METFFASNEGWGIFELHWPLDERWYRATIVKCVTRTGKHLVVYEEDGVQEYVHLEQEEWRVVQVPQPGECRVSGYGQDSPPALSPHCHVVWLSFFALLMFARLYLVMRVLRDSTTLWRYRSIIKAAAVSRFSGG